MCKHKAVFDEKHQQIALTKHKQCNVNDIAADSHIFDTIHLRLFACMQKNGSSATNLK